MLLCKEFAEDSWLRFVCFPAGQTLYKMNWLKRGSDKCSSVLTDIFNQFFLTEGNWFIFCYLPPTAHIKTFATEGKIIVSTTFRSKKVQKQDRKEKYISSRKTHLTLKISADSESILLSWWLLPTVDSSHSSNFRSWGEWVQRTHTTQLLRYTCPIQTVDPHYHWRYACYG